MRLFMSDMTLYGRLSDFQAQKNWSHRLSMLRGRVITADNRSLSYAWGGRIRNYLDECALHFYHSISTKLCRELDINYKENPSSINRFCPVIRLDSSDNKNISAPSRSLTPNIPFVAQCLL